MRDPQITVTGEAEVLVPPDQVVITLGIEQFHKVLATARKEAEQITAKAIALGEAHGIARGDLQTEHASFEVSHDWDSSVSRGTIKGYWARKVVVATMKDLSRFEGFLEAAVEAGVTNLHGIRFQTSELRKHRDRARELALTAAKEKASALASQAGALLGKAIQIREGADRWYSPWGSWWGGGGRGGMSQNVQNVAMAAGPADAGSGTAVGRIGVTASIEATYALD